MQHLNESEKLISSRGNKPLKQQQQQQQQKLPLKLFLHDFVASFIARTPGRSLCARNESLHTENKLPNTYNSYMYFRQEPDLGGFYAKIAQNGSIQGQKAGERAPRIPKEPHSHHQTTSPKRTKPGLIHNNDYKKCSGACSSKARGQTWRRGSSDRVGRSTIDQSPGPAGGWGFLNTRPVISPRPRSRSLRGFPCATGVAVTRLQVTFKKDMPS